MCMSIVALCVWNVCVCVCVVSDNCCISQGMARHLVPHLHNRAVCQKPRAASYSPMWAQSVQYWQYWKCTYTGRLNASLKDLTH